jgi:hypothetical protein
MALVSDGASASLVTFSLSQAEDPRRADQARCRRVDHILHLAPKREAGSSRKRGGPARAPPWFSAQLFSFPLSPRTWMPGSYPPGMPVSPRSTPGAGYSLHRRPPVTPQRARLLRPLSGSRAFSDSRSLRTPGDHSRGPRSTCVRTPGSNMRVDPSWHLQASNAT